MQVYLVIDIDDNGASVTPRVGVTTHNVGMGMEARSNVEASLDTVRRGTEITNKLLGFADGLKTS
jgi:hypothetical protein